MSDSHTVVLSRRELYDRLWQKATTKVAKEFGISDVALGKICRRHNIPKPPLGYWAKVQHKKRVRRTPLPRNADAALEQITIHRFEGVMEKELFSPEVIQVVDAEKQPDRRIQVAEVLDAPLPLIEKTNRSLRSAAPDARGLISPKAKGCLPVRVGKDSIDRAMRILDALIKAFKERAIRFWLEGDEYSRAYVEVAGERFHFDLDEHLAKRERPLTQEELANHQRFPTLYPHTVKFQEYPSGILKLDFNRDGASWYSRKRFSEKKGLKLERRLNKCIVWLHKEADRIKECERQRVESEKRRIVEAKLREEEDRRRRIEAARFDDFQKKTASWRQAQDLRAYVSAVEDAGTKPVGSIPPESKLRKWLSWAKGRIQALDPVENHLKQLSDEEQPQNPETDDDLL